MALNTPGTVSTPTPGTPQTSDKAWVGGAIAGVVSILGAVATAYFGSADVVNTTLDPETQAKIAQAIADRNWIQLVVVGLTAAVAMGATFYGVWAKSNKQIVG